MKSVFLPTDNRGKTVHASGCTGWSPNQSSYAWSKSIEGDRSLRYNLGDDTTYRSQPTCVIPKENTAT